MKQPPVELMRRANVVVLVDDKVGAFRCETCGDFASINPRIPLNIFVSCFLEFGARHQHQGEEITGLVAKAVAGGASC